MEKVKILLVDDKRENIFALESLLKSDEIEFYPATSGVAALELLLKHDFALALLDVQMPEMDGFELAQLMRGTEATRNVPIIFVTAGTRNQHITFLGYEKGAVDFLYKPLDPYVVKSKVQVFIELARQRKLIGQQLDQTRRALQERDEALTTAKTALKIRDEFMAIASHELKTPITSLKLQLQMGRRKIAKNSEGGGAANEDLIRMLNATNRQVDRLSELVDELLDISRIQAGKLELIFQPFGFDQLAREVGERFEAALTASGNSLEFAMDPDLQVEWDPLRIEQVLVNLIGNAAKYAPGTPVTLSAHRMGDEVQVSVTDRGPGIPIDRQARIFERFQRANTSQHVSGLGIGLYITSEIVRAHQGKMWLECPPSGGASFLFRLPVRPQVPAHP